MRNRTRNVAVVLLVFAATLCAVSAFRQFPVPDPKSEANREYWYKQASREIGERIRRRPNEKVAKNVIFFLGDGMGIPTVSAGRVYKGQKKGNSGEEEHLTIDDFPYMSLSKTYGLDYQTSDSANTATAYLSGIKANYGTIGVDHRFIQGQCHNDTDGFVDSLMAWSLRAKKATGVVTTTRITHASPAGTYAHTGHRDWEGQVDESCPPDTKDIAHQLVHDFPGRDFTVILGGGAIYFEGRNDSRNLTNEWLNKDPENRMFVRTKKQLLAVKPTDAKNIMGLFSNSHLPYYIDMTEEQKNEIPTLAEMTQKAIEMLDHHGYDEGWTLFVEGGRIDQAHHETRAQAALEEMFQFDLAIETALKLVNTEETLIVVTADHSHTFAFGGYPRRGNIITGLANDLASDNLTYTTLSYTNGPSRVPRRNKTEEEVTDPKYVTEDVGVFMIDEVHGGEDVGVFAKGPWAHLFSGVHDQSYIPHVIAHAACLEGPPAASHRKLHCAWKNRGASATPLSLAALTAPLILLYHLLTSAQIS